jgi:hypothetical protein
MQQTRVEGGARVETVRQSSTSVVDDKFFFAGLVMMPETPATPWGRLTCQNNRNRQGPGAAHSCYLHSGGT